MKIKTEKLSMCPVCGSENLNIFLQGFDYETHTGAYDIDECGSCRLKFTNPRPIASDIPKLYEDRDSTDFVKSSSLLDSLRSFSIQRFLASLPNDKLAGGNSVLDFGCGDGFFAKEIAAFNPSLNLVATDFHEDSPPRISGYNRIDYKSHAYLAETLGFDVIFCRHVLEHSLDPVDTIRNLTRRLNKGGCLIIEVPNVNSVWGKIFGKYYFAYYLPRHLFHFDVTTLRTSLSLFDDVIIELRDTPLLGRSISYLLGLPLITNTGFIGLSLYPLQVALDRLFKSSSTLLAIARNRQ